MVFLLEPRRQGVLEEQLLRPLVSRKCLLDDGSWNDARWREYRTLFEAHVVED